MNVPGRCESIIPQRDGATDVPAPSVRVSTALAEPACLRRMPTRGRQ
jgi:hypothetical protein